MKNFIENDGSISIDNNLLGQKYGLLTIIDLAGYVKEKNSERIRKKPVALCKCDCGLSCKVRIKDLKRGLQKSCGCLKKHLASNQGKRNTLKNGNSSLNALYNSYYQRAKKKSIEFNITKEDFKNLTNLKCTYCHIDPYKDAGRLNKSLSSTYLYNGLDRVDNKIGYTIENVVPCCEICNKAKRDLDLQSFLNWIERIRTS